LIITTFNHTLPFLLPLLWLLPFFPYFAALKYYPILQQSSQQNFRIQIGITILGVVLLVAKFTAFFFTHSLAILTDALESIVNVIAGFIGLYSLYLVTKPRDKEHPYGHGKAEFVSAAAEGALIIAAGILIVYEAVQSAIHPNAIESLDTGLILVTITAIINYVAGAVCLRYGKRNKSMALTASGKHLQVDTYSTIAIVAGLIIVLITKLYWLDTIIALLVSGVILWNGYKIMRASLAGIMDEADTEILKQLVVLLNDNRRENLIDIHNLRVIKYGITLHVDCHITVPWYLNVHDAHKEVDALNDLIINEFGNQIEMFVHTDGCLPFSCTICSKKYCKERLKPFEKRIPFTLENIIDNKKHNQSGSGKLPLF